MFPIHFHFVNKYDLIVESDLPNENHYLKTLSNKWTSIWLNVHTYALRRFPSVWSSLFTTKWAAFGTFVSFVIVILQVIINLHFKRLKLSKAAM